MNWIVAIIPKKYTINMLAVTGIFRKHGLNVIDCDEIAHAVCKKVSEILYDLDSVTEWPMN